MKIISQHPVWKSLLILLLLIPLRVYATEIDGINYYLDSKQKTAAVGYNTYFNGNLVIPDEVSYDGIRYSVTSIHYSAFNGCSGLTSLTIPNSVTSIENYAFRDCFGLKEVIISDGSNNLTFGASVFDNTPLETLYLGRPLSSSNSDHPFQAKTSLSSLTIGNSVTSISDLSFYGCENLKEVIISDGSKNLTFGADVFPFAPLETLYLGRTFTCTSIYWYEQPFESKTSLRSLTIGNSVTSICDYAFSGCDNLKEVMISDGTTKLIFGTAVFNNVPLETLYLGRTFNCTSSSNSDQPFERKTSLRSLTIGASVTSIGSSAFSGCSGLIKLTIPNSVTSIGSSAFSGCSGLKEILISDGTENLSFGPNVFDNAPLQTLYLGRTLTGTSTTVGCQIFREKTSLRSLTIGNFVKSIGFNAFSGCSGLTTVIIPNSVTSIGENAFNSCIGLVSVSIGDSVTSIGSSAFSGCSGLKSLTIPDSVTSIGSSAFSGCSGLTSLTISDSVTSIGSSTFADCSGLASLTIPNSVTSIGSSAFSGCSGLTSLTIPNSVTSIDNYAFHECTGLKEFNISDGKDNLSFGCLVFHNVPLEILYLGRTFTCTSSYYNEQPFREKTSLRSLTIGNSVTSIGSSAFSGCSGLTSLTIPDSITSIDISTFSNCSGLTSLTIPVSVTSIGSSAFSGCSGLTSLTIPDAVTSIGNYAFRDCRGLKELKIAESVISIGLYTFYGCSGLTSVTIPASVLSIGEGAFIRCFDLKEIIISDGTDILSFDSWVFDFAPLQTLYLGRNFTCTNYNSDQPFRGKTTLTSVTIGNSVTSIDRFAFAGCSGLTSLTIPDSVTSIGTSAFSGCSGLTSLTIPDSVTSIGTSAFAGCSGLTSLTIPDSVTSIETSAFSGCSGLTSLTIPDSVISIGEGSFKGCSSLKRLACLPMTPPSVYINSFDESTYQRCILEVMKDAESAYRDDEVWSKFQLDILEVKVELIELNPSNWSGQEGDSFQIIATIYPGNATDKFIEWSSSDETVAIVDENGYVTILKEGYCIITAKACDGSGVEATCKIEGTSSIESPYIDDQSLTVFTTSGVMLFDGVDANVLNRLEPGVYILCYGNKVQKILVK